MLTEHFYLIWAHSVYAFAYASRTQIVEQLLLTYDKTEPPDVLGPITVEVDLMVESIRGISQNNGSLDADIRFTQMWNDPALNYAHMETNKSNITLSSTFLSSLWSPNVCFINSKSARNHLSPSPNVMLTVSRNGTVRVNIRVRVEGPCEMDMSNFPMDTLRCKLILESYSYNADEVELRWMARNTVDLADYSIPEFVLVDAKYGRNELLYTAGVWIQLQVQFTFKRQLGYYIIKVYLPTQVCVAVSWVSFYLDTTAIPARASVGVSTLMALTLTYGNLASKLPKASYLRALDFWMSGCMLLTFLALLEFSFVAFIEKYKANEVSGKQSADCENGAKFQKRKACPKLHTLGSSLDSISAKAFPVIFLAFNIIYWSYYLRCYFSM